MADEQYELNIILPVFNEARNIEGVLRDACAFIRREGTRARIIVIDDGSSDATPQVLEAAALSCPYLQVIRHLENQGYGAALRSGIKAAQGRWVLLMDADGQFETGSLKDIWPCRARADFWLGYRRQRKDSLYRKFLGRVGNGLASVFLGRSIRDVNCGFKLFKRELVQDLDLAVEGGAVNFEILQKLFKTHPSAVMRQFAVTHHPRHSGLSTGGRPQVIFKIIKEGAGMLLKEKGMVLEGLILMVLLAVLAEISYSHAGEGISVVKYHLQWGSVNLLKNYALYQHSFRDFIYRGCAFHQGNSEAEWRTAFYLLPLFIFCSFLGGLSLKTMCCFTITVSLVTLVLFYAWVRTIWGRQAAFFAALLFGFSAVFQEIARSGSYEAYSLMAAMVWILYFFRMSASPSPAGYLGFGLITGWTWYGYGILRCLTPAALIQLLSFKDEKKWRSVALFLSGMLVVIVPGFLVMLRIYHNEIPQRPFSRLFFDRENIHRFKELVLNLQSFAGCMLGRDHYIEPFVRDTFHAHFWSPWLVVPLVMGMAAAFRQRRQAAGRSLLILSAVIYLTMPLLTSHIGYWQARRSLLYVLPSYCFIGLGMKQIFDGIIRVGGRIKWTGTIILAGALGLILISEGGILRGRILTRQDIGLLPLAEKIREMGLEGDLYYVERKNPGYYTKMGDVSMARGINSLYEADFESDVLSLALMDHGQTLPTVRGLGVKSPLPAAAPAHFYIVQSPLVAGNEFERWCSRNRIRHRLIFELKPVDLPRGEARLVCGPFKLFDAIRG